MNEKQDLKIASKFVLKRFELSNSNDSMTMQVAVISELSKDDVKIYNITISFAGIMILNIDLERLIRSKLPFPTTLIEILQINNLIARINEVNNDPYNVDLSVIWNLMLTLSSEAQACLAGIAPLKHVNAFKTGLTSRMIAVNAIPVMLMASVPNPSGNVNLSLQSIELTPDYVINFQDTSLPLSGFLKMIKWAMFNQKYQMIRIPEVKTTVNTSDEPAPQSAFKSNRNVDMSNIPHDHEDI